MPEGTLCVLGQRTKPGEWPQIGGGAGNRGVRPKVISKAGRLS
jgi:hypothetical protein